ncbi:multicopper oxidase family protein [Labrys sp. ZIDIC5]|uniref:multicopper oxidase family protein n=1 Tax=Labrys sedimenti TaxID=3106036 RepID=UPI002ACA4D44|nr:multicopper oxidase family protein [Labrys sp. ZIDIC5]MDZ5452517.1 multicopper oxidase family protein [Labrys sp. ZIDIC5]
MNRREFLLSGVAALVISGPAAAQMQDHSKHGMDMPGMSPGDGKMAAPGPLPTLPEGAPLRDLPRLANRVSGPGRFEAELTARPATVRFAEGIETPILAYDGETPGPLIEVTEGDKVAIRFANRLPGEETTIHWHGMPVPADQDGNPMDPVLSGADRLYTFELPEGSAGSYWYHPHPHGRTAEQVYRGLAGAFIVKPRQDPIPAAYGDTPLFFTDLRLAADGSIPANTMADLMNGRVGDHVLVNGQKKPVLTLPAGCRRRFRLFNASNARFLHLNFGEAPVTLIGSDGGLLEAPVTGLRTIDLAPAERAEIIVAFDQPGRLVLRAEDVDHGWMGPGRPDTAADVMTIDVTADKAEQPPPLSAELRSIADLGQPVVRRRLEFTETMSMGEGGMKMGFLINGVAFDMNRVDLVAKAGQTELWEIANLADMDHPFHLHGTQFQPVETERDGRVSKTPYRAWKDTINVARGQTVRLLVRQDHPGLRMYHCHILEHEQLGMMGVVEVRA